MYKSANDSRCNKQARSFYCVRIYFPLLNSPVISLVSLSFCSLRTPPPPPPPSITPLSLSLSCISSLYQLISKAAAETPASRNLLSDSSVSWRPVRKPGPVIVATAPAAKGGAGPSALSCTLIKDSKDGTLEMWHIPGVGRAAATCCNPRSPADAAGFYGQTNLMLLQQDKLRCKTAA